MSEQHREHANRVVEVFKQTLSEAARAQISDTQFRDLTLMIQEAISEELTTAADLVAEVSRKIRAQVRKPDIGL